MDFLSSIKDVVGENNVISNELMSAHTTFKVGGPAKYYVVPQNVEQIRKCIEQAKEYKTEYTVIGNGSNLLVSDSGYDGMILVIGKNMCRTSVDGNRIFAEAGISLAALFNVARNNSLKGFEFAAGIPGNLGGACFMNAGAYGGEMKDVLVNVETLDDKGSLHTYEPGGMELGYRSSAFQKNGEIVVSAVIELQKGDVREITKIAGELAKKRIEKQPLEYPSAGSTFKRPEGHFAGALIERAGLKGKGIGGAAVSDKHAGFVINKNNATAKDIYDTILFVTDRVKENSGILLEPEVRMLGKF